jgi:flagellar biosynthesis/type III secretory pathway M-ring protein FliF/YscJ
MMVPVVALALFVLFVLRPLVKFLTTSPEDEYDLRKLLPGDILKNPELTVGDAARGAIAGRDAANNKAIGAQRKAVQQIGDNSDTEAAADGDGEALSGDSASQGSDDNQAAESRERGVIEGLEPSINLEQFEEIVAENVRLVKENPQQAALLIRYWLNDGRI